MIHTSNLAICIDEIMPVLLRTQSAAHAAIAEHPGERSVLHAELADRYAILARRVERGEIDWTAEDAEAVSGR